MSTEHHNKSKFSIEEFYIKNKKNVNIGLGALVLLVAGYIYYSKYYMPAQEEEASAALYSTQRYFEKDSMDLVLNGDGKNPGAIDIADEYSHTKAGNLAKFYAGRAYLSKGDFKKALEYLEKTSFNDEMMAPLSIMLIGDCQVELNNYEDAASNFMKAANLRKNNFTAPLALMKAGRVYEKLNNWEKALKAYEKIKKEYKDTEYGATVDKYIYRAKAKTEA